MAKEVSIEIGFNGGSSAGVSVTEDALEQLTKELGDGAGSGWYTVTAGDGGELRCDLSQVVFIRIGARSRSIGFSHA